jgi:hypothetical protein
LLSCNYYHFFISPPIDELPPQLILPNYIINELNSNWLEFTTTINPSINNKQRPKWQTKVAYDSTIVKPGTSITGGGVGGGGGSINGGNINRNSIQTLINQRKTMTSSSQFSETNNSNNKLNSNKSKHQFKRQNSNTDAESYQSNQKLQNHHRDTSSRMSDASNRHFTSSSMSHNNNNKNQNSRSHNFAKTSKPSLISSGINNNNKDNCSVSYQLSNEDYNKNGWTAIKMDIEENFIHNDRRIMGALNQAKRNIDDINRFNETYSLTKPVRLRFYGDYRKDELLKYKIPPASNLKAKKSNFAMAILRNEIPKGPIDIEAMIQRYGTSSTTLNGDYFFNYSNSNSINVETQHYLLQQPLQRQTNNNDLDSSCPTNQLMNDNSLIPIYQV